MLTLIVHHHYRKAELDALAAIFAREQLQNCISYPDHEERHYRLDASQLPDVRRRLREAELMRAWLVKGSG